MSTVTFNDDIVLSLPYGWGSKEGWEDGKRKLRIAGPGAGSVLYSSEEYDCDIELLINDTAGTSPAEVDLRSKLKEISAKAPDIQISVSVTPSWGGGSTSRIGGSGFHRNYSVYIDEPYLKSGSFTMGILGETACVGVILTDKCQYLLLPLKSQKVESSQRYVPTLLESVELLHDPLTPEEREEKRRREEEAEREERARLAEARRQQQERERAERERKEREAAERKKQEEKKKKEQQAAYDKAMAQWEAQKSKAEADRTREWDRRLAQLERGEKTAVETEYEDRKKAAERDLKRLQKQEKQAQEALDVLGAFQVSEKQEQKKLLRSARAGAEQAKRELEAAEKAHLDALAAFSERLEKKKADLTQELDRKYPVPKQPDRGDYFPEEREQAEKRRKEEERKAEAERKRKEQAAKEEAQRREEAQKREAANRKESIRKTIAIILTVVGSIVFVIGLINGCQGGRDTSGWIPVIIGGFFAAWIGIKLLNGSI